jgi:hypothetical protein
VGVAKRKVRIRAKRLDQIAEDRLALAIWLIARDLVEDKTTPLSPDPEEGDALGEPGEDAG